MTKKKETTSPSQTLRRSKRKLLMLLDGNAIIHRAFHGVPPLSLDDGTPSNAVYGFTSTLLTVLTKFQPDYIVATFDLPGGTFRNELYPEYKGKRKELDPDLVPQFDLVKDVVRAMNIEILEKENYEADDVIGTLSMQAKEQDTDVVIVTGDKDTLQLVNDHVKVFTMSRGIHDMLLYDADLVKEKMGVTVEQVIDYKGIRGDSSDNIPGVRGIGEKGATELLGEYGDLDGVYAHLDEIKPALVKKLTEHKELAYLSKQLGTIALDVPVELSLKDSVSSDIDFAGARKAFQKFQFTSLVKRLDKSSKVESRKSKVESGEDASRPGLDPGSKADKKSKDKKKPQILTGPAAVEFLGVCESKEVVMVLDADDSKLYGVALQSGDKGAYITLDDSTSAAMEKFLTGGKAKIIYYDMKALWHQCDRLGQKRPQIWRDVLLLAYCARTGKRIALHELILAITAEGGGEPEKSTAQMALELRDDTVEQQRVLECVSEIAEIYDVLVTEMDVIAAEQESAQTPTVWHVFEGLEMPLARILYDMEIAGIMFDENIFTGIATTTNVALEKLTKSIHAHAGSEFNINSTKQLRVVLFEDLKIPIAGIARTKTGYSTASSELEKMRERHEIITEIERYRELFKLKTTYIDALPKLVADDGRIHTTYNQAVTSTGRLSSSDPNLQNIPIRTEVGRALRAAFVAGKGKKLISADYSQIELRCVAHVASDKAMIEAFQKGADIHTFTSARVLGKEMDDITKEERSRAKELNFGLIYGMGSMSFAKSSGLTHDEAKDFIARYFGTFTGIKEYMDGTKLSAHENGFVETLEGRRYYVNGITSKNAMMRSGAERAAINMPIQGLAAEIMKLAMIAVDAYCRQEAPEGTQMLLQVHDEIILETTTKDADKVTADVKRVMEGVYDLAVPLIADAEIGKHWGEL